MWGTVQVQYKFWERLVMGYADCLHLIVLVETPYTLNFVTGSGHVNYQENPLACKLHGNSSWKIISFYLLYSQLDIFSEFFDFGIPHPHVIKDFHYIPI